MAGTRSSTRTRTRASWSCTSGSAPAMGSGHAWPSSLAAYPPACRNRRRVLMFDVAPRQRSRKSVYEQWVADQGVPLVQGHYIADLKTAPVEPWARRNASGCFINHDASNTSNDCYLLELAPATETPPQHGLYEEMIYVLKARGATTVWYDEHRKSSFEWSAGALFAIPMNAWHQHFNASGSEPMRYIGVTSAPIAINLYGDPEFIFNCDYRFTSRYTGEADYFNGDGKLTGMVWETNFVADVP